MQKLTYIRCGDYYIPDIRLPEEHRTIGRWGCMHRDYLMEHNPIHFNDMCLSGELWTYLADLNEQAQSRLELIINEIVFCQVKIPGIATKIPWSLPNKISGSATLLHPHEGVSQAVAWASKSNQVAMMGQTVNHGGRHLVISKNGTPLGKLQVGGNDQAAPFVAA